MALSGALSCFEEVWALALAFVFCLQNQNYTQSLGKLYSLGGGVRGGVSKRPQQKRKLDTELAGALGHCQGHPAQGDGEERELWWLSAIISNVITTNYYHR